MDGYPATALRAGEQGMVQFRLEVDSPGRATGCTITQSSGFALLDLETCRRLAVRARFVPARGVIWSLPPPPEPPLPAAAR